MNRVLPILFNTDMVRAILDGRKTVTRRLIKPQQLIGLLPDKCKNGTTEEFLKEKKYMFKPYCDMTDAELIKTSYKPPYQPGDILYVRETWERFDCCSCEGDEHGNCPKDPKKSVLDKSCGCYMYRATDEISGDAKWRPSIHMPKEAARIWLKVKDVRVERIQNITPAQAEREGVGDLFYEDIAYSDKDYGNPVDEERGIAKEQFAWLWNSTIKKSDLDRYGWDANPYVFVIEFMKIDKPEEI